MYISYGYYYFSLLLFNLLKDSSSCFKNQELQSGTHSILEACIFAFAWREHEYVELFGAFHLWQGHLPRILCPILPSYLRNQVYRHPPYRECIFRLGWRSRIHFSIFLYNEYILSLILKTCYELQFCRRIGRLLRLRRCLNCCRLHQTSEGRMTCIYPYRRRRGTWESEEQVSKQRWQCLYPPPDQQTSCTFLRWLQ